MKITTLCFCIKDDRILLAMKKRGFGVGKWNGYGGKVQEHETPEAAMVREIKEESELSVEQKDLEQVAIINFYFEGKPVFKCHVFLTYAWTGIPKETEEMRPQWYPLSNLPFDDMWAADRKWIPLVLAGEKIEATVNFNAEGSEIKEFNYSPVSFI